MSKRGWIEEQMEDPEFVRACLEEDKIWINELLVEIAELKSIIEDIAFDQTNGKPLPHIEPNMLKRIMEALRDE